MSIKVQSRIRLAVSLLLALSLCFMQASVWGNVAFAYVSSDVEPQEANTTAVSNPFDNAASSMPKTGNVKVIAITVDFADEKFAEGDNADALGALFNGAAEGFIAVADYPYESVNAYYSRASYGKLSITADTFTYTSAKNRDAYTDNLDTLFTEVLSALDSDVNFNDYDADQDGYIDGVYIHFAGDCGEWASTWWSHVEQFDTESTLILDGKKVKSTCVLHYPSTEKEAAKTLIHETGHLLGMPDLYSYAAQRGDDVDYRTGTLTYDLMENNTGDINAYFKWVLGWIDESKITRIAVGEEGCRVMRGGVLDSATYESVDAVLSAFSATYEEGGGRFVAVSGDFSIMDTKTGLYSDFYLLEYETCTGNSTVNYTSYGDTCDIPGGFRMYQVRGTIVTDTGCFEYGNTESKPGNKLIELVDYDSDKTHISNLCMPLAEDGTYGCILTAGATVGPTTTPSTNIGYSIALGFTGIRVDVLDAGGTTGKLSISYESTEVPTPDTFTISLSADQGAIVNSGTIVCESSFVAEYSPVDTILPAYLQVGDDVYPLSVSVSGGKISLTYALTPGLINKAADANIVFVEGDFLIGVVDGEEVRSSEITVPLDFFALPDIEASGYYDATDNTLCKSDAFTLDGVDDGALSFLRLTNSGLIWNTIDSDNPTKVVGESIEGFDFSSEVLGVSFSLQTVVLDETKLGVLYKSSNVEPGTYFVIDGTTKSVVKGSMCEVSSEVRDIFTVGDIAAYSEYYPSTDEYAIVLLDGANASDASYIYTRGYKVYDAGLGLTAVCSTDSGESGPACAIAIDLYDSYQLKDLIYNKGSKNLANLFDDSYSDALGQTELRLEDAGDDLTLVTSIVFSEALELNDVKAFSDGDNLCAGIYVLGRMKLDASTGNVTNGDVLAKYDMAGSRLASQDVDTLTFNSHLCELIYLVPGNSGELALTYVCGVSEPRFDAFAKQETILIDSDFNQVGVMTDASNTHGGWVGGKWLSLGFSTNHSKGGSGGALGSPLIEATYDAYTTATAQSSLEASSNAEKDSNYLNSLEGLSGKDEDSYKVHYALTKTINAEQPEKADEGEEKENVAKDKQDGESEDLTEAVTKTPDTDPTEKPIKYDTKMASDIEDETLLTYVSALADTHDSAKSLASLAMIAVVVASVATVSILKSHRRNVGVDG